MSSNQIPGVPEGWEVEHVSRFGEPGEHCVSPEGEPHLIVVRTVYRVCIIRKIEKPARYRHFKDADEYLPHWGKPIRLKDGTGFDSVVSTSKLGVYVAAGSTIIRHAMVDAFRLFEFADGTPFGVCIDE
jgi:hypothetical protein